MDKDQDYSWIIVGAGCLIMLFGPSTYNTNGLLFENVEIGGPYHVWMLNVMYNVFALSGFLAVILSSVFTPRKIAMLGCFTASCGFLIASSTLKHRIWLFFAFAGVVGIGLGLAVHVTFILVASSFEKYIGLANGVHQMIAAIGYLVAPYIYNILPGLEDRFHIKALVTVISFLGAILFISPHSWQFHSNQRRMRTSTCSRVRNTSSHPRPFNYKVNNEPQVSSLQETEMMDLDGNFTGRTRKRSHYLLAVSAAILPNIPEESDSLAPTTGTCTPVSGASSNNLHSLKNSLVQVNTDDVIENKCERPNNSIAIETDLKSKETSGQEQENEVSSQLLIQQLPKKSKTFTRKNSQSEKKTRKVVKSNLSLNRVRHSVTTNMNEAPRKITLGKRILKTFASIDLKYLKNPEFMVMAVGGSLALLSSPSVPIVLYAYLGSIYNHDYKGEGETALLIIFTVDIISRLISSYISDFPWFKRRTSFSIGNTCVSVIIACFGFSEDCRLIYALCVSYGVCHGLLIVNESIMFIDVFGLSSLPTTYGIYKCFQVMINILTTLLVGSPTSAYTYTIHPLTTLSNEKYRFYQNSTSFPDPLGIFQYNQDMTQALSFQTVFLIYAAPGIFSAIPMLILTFKPEMFMSSQPPPTMELIV